MYGLNEFIKNIDFIYYVRILTPLNPRGLLFITVTVLSDLGKATYNIIITTYTCILNDILFKTTRI